MTLVVDNGWARLLTARDGKVKQWQSRPLRGGMVEGIVRDPESVGADIAELFAETRASPKAVITCVSGAQAVHRTFTLPAVAPKDLPNAVLFQAKRDFPVPLDDLVFTWQLLESTEERSQVYALGIQKDTLKAYLKALDHAGVRPAAMDVKPLALARACPQPDAVVAGIEDDGLDIVYLVNHSPAVVRTLYFAAPADSLLDLASGTAQEIRRTIRAYQDAHPDARVDPDMPVVLAGGGVDFAAMAGALKDILDYPVVRFEPSLSCPEEFPLERYADNLGLVLKQI